MLHELRFAFRTLSRSAGFTVVAVITLALGIGSTTAMFTVLDGVLLKPLRYRDADRIVAVGTYFPKTNHTTPRLTGGDLLDVRGTEGVFEAFSQYNGGEIGVQVADRAEFVDAYLVTPDFARVFSMIPVFGRTFNPDDGDHSALVSVAFAERNFGSGTNALGQTLRVDNHAYTIVGVMPAGFHYPRRAEVWAAVPPQPGNLRRTAYNYPSIAKLAPGVSVDAANAKLATVGSRLAQAFPDSNRDKTFKTTPLQEQLGGPVRTMLYLLMGAVGLVLLIACANVANLMLARATGRVREMAIRVSLGASHWQIIRQLLVESTLLALVAGGLGVLVAQAFTSILVLKSASALALPRVDDIAIDWRVLLFTVLVAASAGIVFGLAPAIQATRVNLFDALKQAGSHGLQNRTSTRLRSALVVAQIAMSFVLVIGAALLFRSFLALNAVELGYRSEGVLVMYAHAPARTLDEAVRVGQFEADLFDRVKRLPGVKSVSGAMGVPTGEYGSNGSYAVEGKTSFTGNLRNLPQAGFRLAGPEYFTTLGIPLLRGRDFQDNDRYDSPFVAIISASLAKETFPHEDPIGQRIQCGLDSPNWMTVVGVVGDVRQDSPASNVGAELYMPLRQHPFHANEAQVVIRTQVEPMSLVPEVERVVRGMNPEVAMRFTTLDAMVSDSIAAPRFRTLLAIAFAGLALVLAIMGVYAVMSYLTAQRKPEFALRMALGASPANILRLVLRGAARLAGIGVAAGLALAIASNRALSAFLFGVKSTDAMTYGLALLAILPLVVLAAAAPAMRAARVDPMVALRDE